MYELGINPFKGWGSETGMFGITTVSSLHWPFFLRSGIGEMKGEKGGRGEDAESVKYDSSASKGLFLSDTSTYASA